jgi:hypothetical protein
VGHAHLKGVKMAGFSQIGPGGFSINPPLMSSPQRSPDALNLSVRRERSQVSSFLNPYEFRGFNTGADESGQHGANVYMAKNGLGDTGQTRNPGYADYGFSPEDYDNITRYLSNPFNNQNVGNYMGITQRLRNQADTNPQFGSFTPQMRQQWSTDFPLQLASGFNLVPPPILQNWNIPVGTAPNIRF